MFHRILSVTLALFLVVSLFAPVQAAEEFTYESGKVDLVCPDGWTHEMDDSKITMTAPGGVISFVFELLEGDELSASLEQAIQGIISALGPTTFGEPTEEKINGMDTLTFEGTCESKGVSVMLSIINTPSDKALCMYYFGAKAAEEAHGAAIAEIVNGIKPATTEVVQEESEGEVEGAGDE